MGDNKRADLDNIRSRRHACSVCKFIEIVTIPALGKVNTVSVSSLALNYKESAKFPIKVDADKNVDYTVSCSSSDSSVAQVDENRNVYAAGTGSVTTTCTVYVEYSSVSGLLLFFFSVGYGY